MFSLPVVVSAQATTTPSTIGIESTTVCPKCGTLQSGRRSCCARGGTWFDNCGDPNEDNFEHTWFEGIQSCENSSSSFLGEQKSHSMLHENATIDQHVPDRKQLDDDSTYGGVTNAKCYEGFAVVAAFSSLFYVLSIFSYGSII